MIQKAKENITKGIITTVIGVIACLLGLAYIFTPIFVEEFETSNTTFIIFLLVGGIFIIAPDNFIEIAKDYISKK